MHSLYFDLVVIFWIKYNSAGASLYLIQNITTRPKYNSCNVLFTIKYLKYNTKIFESSCLENQNNPIWPTCSKQQILIKQECGWLWWGSIWWKVFQVLRFVDKYLDLWNIFLDLFGISVTKTNRRDHLYFSQIMIQWKHT